LSNTLWRYGMVLMFIVSLFNLSVELSYAQATVTIVAVEPDVRGQEIPIGGAVKEVKLVANTSRPGLQLQWSLEGPGRFDGNTTGIASFYVLPEKISGTTAQVKITITATDPQGGSAKDTVGFTLVAHPSALPSPTSPAKPLAATQTENGLLTLRDRASGFEMVFVRAPGGTYQMGCGPWADKCGSDEQVHPEQVETFWIGQTEVMRKQWQQVLEGASSLSQEEGVLPIDNVSWEDVQEFIRKLGVIAPKYEARLPTEVEWEYACRSGGKPENYAGSNTPDEAAWYLNTSDRKIHPVGQKQPNGLGIYDMSGNVREWMQNDYSPGDGIKAARGGGWLNGAQNIRCSNREQYFPNSRKAGLGFRVVLKPK